MSKIEVNQISSQCGSTLTIGQSGDTVTLACGATQSGFGRTGTVDWDTTAKTASFTAVSGNGYFVNTTSGAVTLTLPASPSAGDIVAIADYARTFATNNVTVGRNGSNIQGEAVDGTIRTNGQSTTFVYVDGTKGWVPTEDQTTGNYGASYVTATGGTITTCGDYKIHTFTGPGTFCVSVAGNPGGSNTVDYIVVAGGGGGGAGDGGAGGGGGAGGYRESSGAASGCYTASPLGACVSALPVSAQGYPITIGSGGSGAQNRSPTPTGNPGGNGSNSIFSTITSTGGGGGFGGPGNNGSGNSGGSGGGSVGLQGYPSPTAKFAGGAGNTPPVTPPQGNNGGEGNDGHVAYTAGGGGGGAGAVGGPSTPTSFPQPESGVGGSTGGNGVASSITGSSVTRAGGGGGSANPDFAGGPVAGGSGGGGAGLNNSPSVSYPNNSAESGTANTGGGGGAIVRCTCGTTNAGAGGSGIVIIRYKYQN
jgi:hypothetical protein